MIKKFRINTDNFKNIIKIKPIGYFDTLNLIKKSSIVFTDSGGIQKESFFLRTHFIILRNITEWPELIDMGWGKIWTKKSAFKKKNKNKSLGSGIISKKIINKIYKYLNK